jgi:Tol biopolymer transport system component
MKRPYRGGVVKYHVLRQLALLAIGLVVVLVVAGQLARADAGPSPGDPQDTAPALSTDGGQVAFTESAKGQTPRVLVMTAAGTALHFISDGVLRGWVPNANRIVAQPDGAHTVVLNAQGGNFLPTGSVLGVDATPSPDGRRLAYLRNGEMFVAAIDGSGERRVATQVSLPTGDAVGPAWSPDGTRIALASASGLIVADADGSGSHVVLSTAVANPSWSPDARTIAYESRVPPHHSIWLVNADGTGNRLLAGGAFENRLPQFSPVSNTVAFISNRNEVLPEYGLYTQTTDSSVARRIVDDVDPSSLPRWSTTAALIAVAARQECRRDGIYLTRPEIGSRPQRRSNLCRLDGAPAADTIHGTPYFDIINGNGGNDVIYGLGGNDKISGEGGNDTIYGGAGNDFILAGPGNDRIYGGAGNDTIIGGNGRDRIDCGSGNDTVEGAGPLDSIARNCEHVRR